LVVEIRRYAAVDARKYFLLLLLLPLQLRRPLPLFAQPLCITLPVEVIIRG
jgi:hypothetical protein